MAKLAVGREAQPRRPPGTRDRKRRESHRLKDRLGAFFFRAPENDPDVSIPETTVRDGSILRVHNYAEKAEALRAAGLAA